MQAEFALAAAACTTLSYLPRWLSKPSAATAELPAVNRSCPCCCAVELDMQQPFCHCSADYVSCPSCGRTLFDLQEVTESIRQRTGHLPGERGRLAGLPSAFALKPPVACVPYHPKAGQRMLQACFMVACLACAPQPSLLASTLLHSQASCPHLLSCCPLHRMVPCWQLFLTCPKQKLSGVLEVPAAESFSMAPIPHRLQAQPKLPVRDAP